MGYYLRDCNKSILKLPVGFLFKLIIRFLQKIQNIRYLCVLGF